MNTIDKNTLTNLSKEAKESERFRKNKNFHTNYNDPINRMLNAFEPGTYVQPHKHETPDKREVFIILKGKLGVILWTETGEIKETLILEPENIPIVEFAPNEWHSIVSLESGTVVYEIKDGPYIQAEDKNFASWAPKEGESGVARFVKNTENLF